MNGQGRSQHSALVANRPRWRLQSRGTDPLNASNAEVQSDFAAI